MQAAFLAGEIDAAFVTVGVHARVLREIFAATEMEILPVENPAAMEENYFLVSPYEIPAGLYPSRQGRTPPAPVPTVAIKAQLLTRRDVPARFVSRVTRLVLGDEFLKSNDRRVFFDQRNARQVIAGDAAHIQQEVKCP